MFSADEDLFHEFIQESNKVERLEVGFDLMLLATFEGEDIFKQALHNAHLMFNASKCFLFKMCHTANRAKHLNCVFDRRQWRSKFMGCHGHKPVFEFYQLAFLLQCL